MQWHSVQLTKQLRKAIYFKSPLAPQFHCTQDRCPSRASGRRSLQQPSCCPSQCLIDPLQKSVIVFRSSRAVVCRRGRSPSKCSIARCIIVSVCFLRIFGFDPFPPQLFELATCSIAFVLLKQEHHEILVGFEGVIALLKSFDHVGPDGKGKHAHAVIKDVQKAWRHQK